MAALLAINDLRKLSGGHLGCEEICKRAGRIRIKLLYDETVAD